jgi:hypothetical protein
LIPTNSARFTGSLVWNGIVGVVSVVGVVVGVVGIVGIVGIVSIAGVTARFEFGGVLGLTRCNRKKFRSAVI